MAGRPGPSRMHSDDPRFEEWCVNELEADDDFISDIDDGDDYIIESDHDSESVISVLEEIAQSSDEELELQGDNDLGREKEEYYFGRGKNNKTKW